MHSPFCTIKLCGKAQLTFSLSPRGALIPEKLQITGLTTGSMISFTDKKKPELTT
jgi:hypothetical protein